MGLVVACDDLRFTWGPASLTRFEGLSLQLHSGHIYGLMGRNGAGKTTLIKLLCGLLAPHSGRAETYVNGRAYPSIARRPEALAEVVFVPESSELPPVGVTELGKLLGVLYPRFTMEAYQLYLQALEVPTNASLQRLSFGQRRKAHIAFALATDASLVFLDEPSNGLDIAAQIALRKLLISHVSAERSLVVSTHHVREFENVVDQVIVLEHGRILANDPLETLRDRPRFTDLETWYAQLIGVMESTPRSGESSTSYLESH